MSLNCVINDSGNFLLHTSRQVFWTDDSFFSVRPIWKYFGKIWITYKASFPVSLDINVWVNYIDSFGRDVAGLKFCSIIWRH